MRVALTLKDFLHIAHGIVVAPGARQLDGCRALCLEIARVVFRPDHRRVESGLIGAQILGYAEGALGYPRILGLDRLGHVVVQRDVEAVALAGKLGGQQADDGVLSKRAVHLRFGLGRGRRFFRRSGRLRRNGGRRLTATQSDKGKEQRGGFIHIEEGRLTCGLEAS